MLELPCLQVRYQGWIHQEVSPVAPIKHSPSLLTSIDPGIGTCHFLLVKSQELCFTITTIEVSVSLLASMSRLTMDLATGITVEAILRTPPATSIKNTLAILLHPWSWLGGQMGDP